MPEFEHAQANVVLRMMLAKSRLSPTASDFTKLADLVNEQNPGRQRPVSDHYFSDMSRSLAKTPMENAGTHAMSQQHMDMCLRFLGYTGYGEFVEHWTRIGSYFDGMRSESSNRTVVFCDEEDESYVASLVDQAFYPGQDREVIRETGSSREHELLSRLKQHTATGAKVVWCLPQSEWSAQLALVTQSTVAEVERLPGIIPLWPELDGAARHTSATRVRHMVSAHSEMPLVLQLAQLQSPCSDTATLNAKLVQPEPINLGGSGTVVLGGMNVEATYFSQNDMHITIHEYKKGY